MDVTPLQVRRLGSAVVFSVTRSVDEAAGAPLTHPSLVWGVGVHPGTRAALERWEPAAFERLLTPFSLVGEIGLDRRSPILPLQQEVFEEIIKRSRSAPVLLSIHSTDCISQVLPPLEEHRPRGVILHWFNGTDSDVARALATGAFFSVNAAMSDAVLSLLPRNRVLTERDFPYTRPFGADAPGSTTSIETRLAALWHCTRREVRETVRRNLFVLIQNIGCGGLLEQMRTAVPKALDLDCLECERRGDRLFLLTASPLTAAHR